MQLGALILAKQAYEDKDPEAIETMEAAAKHALFLASRNEAMIAANSNVLIDLHLARLMEKAVLVGECQEACRK